MPDINNNSALEFDAKKYSRAYRWLGLCTDYYASSEDDDDKAIAADIRKNPAEVLDSLVQIRMALIAFKLSNVTSQIDGNHNVSHEDLNRMIKEYPPKSNDKWWSIWLRYINVMDEIEWKNMWLAIDLTIEDILSEGKVNKTPALYKA